MQIARVEPTDPVCPKCRLTLKAFVTCGCGAQRVHTKQCAGCKARRDDLLTLIKTVRSARRITVPALRKLLGWKKTTLSQALEDAVEGGMLIQEVSREGVVSLREPGHVA